MLSPNEKDLYICNLHNGVDHYTLPQLTLARSFPQPIKHNVPLQIATAFSGELIVVGGDSGIVRVFNAITGNLVNSLCHDPEGTSPRNSVQKWCLLLIRLERDRVQAVAVRTQYSHSFTSAHEF